MIIIATITGTDPARRFATISEHEHGFEVAAWSSPGELAPYAWGSGTAPCKGFKTYGGALRAAKRWAQVS